jgi:hypothetical protein
MVFTHTNQPVSITIYNGICISKFSGRCDRSWPVSRFLAIKARIGEIGEVNCPLMDNESAAAVLMYPSSGIEWRLSNIYYLPILGMTYNHTPATFSRPHFDPVDILTIKNNLVKPGRPGSDHVRCDRRFPGTI